MAKPAYGEEGMKPASATGPPQRILRSCEPNRLAKDLLVLAYEEVVPIIGRSGTRAAMVERADVSGQEPAQVRPKGVAA